MGDPRGIRSDEVEIVVARELRKAGLPLTSLRVLSRYAPTVDDGGSFTIELAGVTPGAAAGAANRDVVVEFQNDTDIVTVDAVRALRTRVPAATTTDGPKRLRPVDASPEMVTGVSPIRVMLSTTGFALAAAQAATSLGIALLRIVRYQLIMGPTKHLWA